MSNNEILIYDFAKKNWENPNDEILNELDIRTISHGSSDITKKGILVEEHNYGRLVFFDESGALFDYINRGKDGNVYQIHFSRLITQKSVINKILSKINNIKDDCK